jgi:hypothetical protein
MIHNSTIRIMRSTQMDGYTFALHPKTVAFLKERGLPVRLARMSVGFNTKSEFERMHGPLWDHIEQILTGLSIEEIRKLGKVEFIDAVTNKPILVPVN